MSSCFKSAMKIFMSPLTGRKSKVNGEGDEFGSDNWGNDPCLWFHDKLLSSVGEVYVAAVQGNMQMEDEIQVETLPKGLFVGIYDGHGGHMASQYVYEHLLDELLGRKKKNKVDQGKKMKSHTSEHRSQSTLISLKEHEKPITIG